MNCSKCGKPFSEGKDIGLIAAISGGIMGDEYIDSWYFCPECQVYTLEVYRDRFTNEDAVNVHGPIDKASGDIRVELIRQCMEPWNKRCRCHAHLEYFAGWLD